MFCAFSTCLSLVASSAAIVSEPQGVSVPAADQAIVVTAQRIPQQAADVPVSITLVSGEDVARERIVSMTEIAAKVPGFTIAQSFQGPPILTLRGIGFNSPNISATSPVGLYQDDAALPYPVMAEGLLFDLERVEILKGPQGTLFGRNTTGGLVNSITRKPTDRFDAYARLMVGSYRGYGGEGAVGGSLAPGLSGRVAISIDQADKGWQKSITRGDRLGRKDRMAARASLRWQPSRDIDVTLTGNGWRDGSDTQAPQSFEAYPLGLVTLGIDSADWAATAEALGLPPGLVAQSYRPTRATQANWTVSQLPWGGAEGGRNFTPAPLDFRKNNDFLSVSLNATFHLTDHLSLQSVTSHAHYRRLETFDSSGWEFENLISNGRGTIATFATEWRLLGNAPRLHWTAGAIFSIDRVRDRENIWAGTNTTLQVLRIATIQMAAASGADTATQEDILFGFRDYANDTRQTAQSFAIFGQAEYRATDTFGITLGLRLTRDRTRFAGCSRDLGDGSLAATMNAFYNGSGIASGITPGVCSTFLADLGAALASGGTIPLPGQGQVRDRLDESNLAGRFALDWKPAPGLMAYASVARGFKSGTFPNIEGNVATQYAPARQEEVLAFETGVKTRLFEWLTFDATAFYADYRNKQVFGGIEDIVFGQLNRVLNMPRSHIYGMEGAFQAQLGSGISLDTGFSLIRTRIDRYSGIDDFGVRRDFAGRSFAYTPGLQLSVDLAREFAAGQGWNGHAAIGYRYSSRQQADLSGDRRFRIDPAHLVDATLALKSPGGAFELSLHVKNVTNTYTWNSVSLQGDSFERYAAMPRTWTLSLTRSY